jgi:hypothetical protein
LHARHGADVEVRLNPVRVGKVDRALIGDPVARAVEEDLAAFTKRGTAGERRPGQGADGTQVAAQREPREVVVDHEILVRHHVHVQPCAIQERVARRLNRRG